MSNAYLHNPQFLGEAFNLESTGQNAVLLFHGFTATCHEVARLGKVLNRAGFATSGPLLPGHGSHPAELNKVRWQDWTAAAESAYQDLAKRYKRVFVGGESNGGLVALYLAAAHPEVAGILAYSPALQVPMSRWQRLKLTLAAPFVAEIPKGDLTGNTTWQGYKVNPPKAILQLLRFQREVRGRLPEITQPILVVQGRNDHTIDPHSSEIVYDQVRSKLKKIVWMEKSGHCVLLDEEQHEVTRLTMDFLYEALAYKA